MIETTPLEQSDALITLLHPKEPRGTNKGLQCEVRAIIRRKPRVSDSLRTENDIFATNATMMHDAAYSKQRTIQDARCCCCSFLLLLFAIHFTMHKTSIVHQQGLILAPGFTLSIASFSREISVTSLSTGPLD
jgi:hypothetical protein